MTSTPNANIPDQFTLEVPEVGAFTFAKRTMRRELRIQAEYSRLTEGVDTPTLGLEMLAGMLSQLSVLTIRGPEGWDLEAIDPLDEREYAKLLRVHAALRAKEDSFRGRSPTGSAQGGQAHVGEPAVLVSPTVQPPAN